MLKVFEVAFSAVDSLNNDRMLVTMYPLWLQQQALAVLAVLAVLT